MPLTWKDLIIDFTHIDIESLTEAWTWLIGPDMVPVMVSSIGDMFLSDKKGVIFWLDVGGGTLKEVATNFTDLRNQMDDDEIANEWFMFDLVEKIKAKGLELSKGKLYSYKQLPIIGGSYESSNFELTDIEIHFHLNGQVHEQIKDLPDGTKVNIELRS